MITFLTTTSNAVINMYPFTTTRSIQSWQNIVMRFFFCGDSELWKNISQMNEYSIQAYAISWFCVICCPLSRFTTGPTVTTNNIKSWKSIGLIKSIPIFYEQLFGQLCWSHFYIRICNSALDKKKGRYEIICKYSEFLTACRSRGAIFNIIQNHGPENFYINWAYLYEILCTNFH